MAPDCCFFKPKSGEMFAKDYNNANSKSPITTGLRTVDGVFIKDDR